jgi:sugar porter (SP) family MFS transporter
MLFQFNVVLGILIAYLSNYLIGGTGPDDWRWMLGIETIPALLFLGLLFRIPESPRWLVKSGKNQEARKTLLSTGEESPDLVLQDIQNSLQKDDFAGNEALFSRKYRFPIILAFLFAFFNQVSGINIIIYYAPRIFEMAGIGKGAALLSSVGIGLVNLVFTIIALSIIDKYGRRQLMKIGSVGLIVFLLLISLAFFAGKEGAEYLTYFIFCYVAFFGLSQGAVIWVFISEVFPNKVRAKGQSFGSFTHWLLAAVIAQVFPGITAMIGGGPTFLFFSVMMVLQLLYVLFVMPETKGISLEELEKVVLR